MYGASSLLLVHHRFIGGVEGGRRGHITHNRMGGLKCSKQGVNTVPGETAGWSVAAAPDTPGGLGVPGCGGCGPGAVGTGVSRN